MPLPVGHSLAGLGLLQLTGLRFFQHRWQDAFFFVFAANLADLDYLPGFLLGNPNLYHQGMSHSLAAALFFGVFCALFFSRKHGGNFTAYATICALVYASHMLLDVFNNDLRAPYGVPLFWPLTEERFISPHWLFASVHKSSESAQFFQSVLSAHNFFVALREVVVMAPVLAVAMLLAKKRRRAGA
ncbi:MAG TPA: metal-dependent hydrolase [Bacteroidetes bacterium]|nr:metal-dependent hydrolase [Bacteroidota bacterium]